MSTAEDHPAANVKWIIAHRGASAERPENTLASARRAIEVGATAVEVDIRTTQDGHLVLSHDATLDHATNGTGKINDKTLAEIQKLDAGSKFSPEYRGEKIPQLHEVLILCKGKIDVLLDLKEEGDVYLNAIVKTIRTHGEPKRIIVGVRSVEQARQMRKLLPEARQIGLIGSPQDIEAFADTGVEVIRIWPKWLADPKFNSNLVERVRKTGAKLHLNGTRGEKAETLDLLKHHPYSLSSDHPAQLLRTLAELKSESECGPAN